MDMMFAMDMLDPRPTAEILADIQRESRALLRETLLRDAPYRVSMLVKRQDGSWYWLDNEPVARGIDVRAIVHKNGGVVALYGESADTVNHYPLR